MAKEQKQFVKRLCAVRTPLPAVRVAGAPSPRAPSPASTPCLPQTMQVSQDRARAEAKGFPAHPSIGMKAQDHPREDAPPQTPVLQALSHPVLPHYRRETEINIATLAFKHLYGSHFKRGFAI